jgi:cyclopropane-fatty-acyl-phospholipid synthase
MGVNQVLAVRTGGDGRSGMPLRRDFLGASASTSTLA